MIGSNQIYQSNQSPLHVQELDKHFVNQLKIGNENINPSRNNNAVQNKQLTNMQHLLKFIF